MGLLGHRAERVSDAALLMRIRMLTSIAGAGFAYRRGAEVDMPDRDALRLLATGQAEHVLPAAAPGAMPASWTLAKSPAEYLKLYPTGPNAGLAREVLGVAGTVMR